MTQNNNIRSSVFTTRNKTLTCISTNICCMLRCKERKRSQFTSGRRHVLWGIHFGANHALGAFKDTN